MALREILAEFGFDVDTEALKKADTGIAKVRASLGALAAGLAAGGALLGIGRFAAEMAGAADAMDKTARAIGVTTRELAQWGEVVQNSGGEVSQFEGGLKNLAKQYRDALKGGEDQIKTFKKLGVSLRDSRGQTRQLGDVLEDSVLGLKNFTNTAQRAAVADDLFAEAGQTLIRVSLDGADALREQRKAFDDLNQGGRFDRFIEVSKENAVAFDGWRNASQALKRNLATALLPALTALVKGATAVVEWFQRMSRGTRVLEVALGALAFALVVAGAAFVGAFATPIAIVLGIAAAVAALVLIVDDLIALFSGGKSVIGAAIDELLGAGQAAIVVESVKEAWDDLTSAVAYGIELFVRVGEQLGEELARVYLGILDGVEAVESAAGAVADAVRALWEEAGNIIEGVIDSIAEAVDAVIGKISGAIDTVTDLAGSAADLLGFGEDEDDAGAPVRARLLPPQERPVVDRRGAGGTTSVRVEQPVSVSVSGAGDPEAVGRAVRAEIERARIDELETARELLLGASR